MYLLVLHQRYSLLKLSVEAVQLNNSKNTHRHKQNGLEKIDYEAITLLREKIAFFMLRIYYKQIRHWLIPPLKSGIKVNVFSLFIVLVKCGEKYFIGKGHIHFWAK